MNPDQPRAETHPGGAANTTTTHWSQIFQARDDGAVSEEAWQFLLRRYRVTIEQYLRWRFPQGDDGLADQFIALKFAPELVAGADPERGRFRGLLRSALESFANDEWRRRRAAKRIPEHLVSPMDTSAADRLPGPVPSVEAWGQRLDRDLAYRIFERAFERTREEHRHRGGGEETFEWFLGRQVQRPVREAATALGISEAMVKKRRWELRRRLREAFVQEVADQTGTADLQAEVGHLAGLLGPDVFDGAWRGGNEACASA